MRMIWPPSNQLEVYSQDNIMPWLPPGTAPSQSFGKANQHCGCLTSGANKQGLTTRKHRQVTCVAATMPYPYPPYACIINRG